MHYSVLKSFGLKGVAYRGMSEEIHDNELDSPPQKHLHQFHILTA